jgi:hypothetical protein
MDAVNLYQAIKEAVNKIDKACKMNIIGMTNAGIEPAIS